jgi:photosystem II stability/assembly factor-like uncharacterized protein
MTAHMRIPALLRRNHRYPFAIVICASLGLSAVPAPRWQTQTSGVTGRLRGVSAVSNLVAWASGQNGTVLRTVDGGKVWRAVPVAGAETLDFRDVDAISDRVAYALSIGPGESSRIYKTTDAGAHWQVQLANTDPRVFLDAMAFWDAERGIAFSDSVDGQFVIFATGNGGTTWTRLPTDRLPPALPSEGAFAASGTNVAIHGTNAVWIGTTASRVLHSADGGRTWTIAAAPLATSASAGIFSIAFRDAQHGIVVGGDYKKEGEAVDNLAITSDGGVTWTLVKNQGLSGFRSAVAWVPGTRRSWLAVGPSGTDRSDDDGQTWMPVPTNGDGFDAVSFAPRSQVGWGTGTRGRIGRVDWSG